MTVTARPTTVLAARDLSLGYSAVPAVSGLDLTLGAGELVVLLGANGAGKSTTLLGLAGELAPLAGVVELDGERCDLPLHSRVRAGVAVVHAERKVVAGLSTTENLRLAGVADADAVAVFPELERLLKRRAGLLSGGEQQMLALARALGMKPRVLLIDELSLGLAPVVVQRLMTVVRAVADSGIAVLLVEQSARQPLAIADWAYVLARGRCVLEGAAADIHGRVDEVERLYLDFDA
jgi:branched-chain amino acid transport system ATP-binding protein